MNGCSTIKITKLWQFKYRQYLQNFWFLENLGSHNSGSIEDGSARLVSIDFSQVVLLAYQISLKFVILIYESLVGFIWSWYSFNFCFSLNYDFFTHHFYYKEWKIVSCRLLPIGILSMLLKLHRISYGLQDFQNQQRADKLKKIAILLLPLNIEISITIM